MAHPSYLLADQGNGNGTATVEISGSPDGINIYINGYGTKTETPGSGCPLFLELYDGKLRLNVWSDINQEGPTHIIYLENALESNRDEK